MKTIKINSINEMKKFGNQIGKSLKGGETICLRGNLGAGKTHLTQYIGEGMGIDEYITSPTFALLNIYNGEINLNHFDTYRLESVEDFEELGFEDYLFSNDVNIIEWPDVIFEFLPESTLVIEIEKGAEEERFINIKTDDEEKYRHIMENITWKFWE